MGSGLSPRAQLGYRVLVDHVNRGRDPVRPYNGEVFLTDETFATELGGVSKRRRWRPREFNHLVVNNRNAMSQRMTRVSSFPRRMLQKMTTATSYLEGAGQGKDDNGVAVICERMTEFAKG